MCPPKEPRHNEGWYPHTLCAILTTDSPSLVKITGHRPHAAETAKHFSTSGKPTSQEDRRNSWGCSDFEFRRYAHADDLTPLGRSCVFCQHLNSYQSLSCIFQGPTKQMKCDRPTHAALKSLTTHDGSTSRKETPPKPQHRNSPAKIPEPNQASRSDSWHSRQAGKPPSAGHREFQTSN